MVIKKLNYFINKDFETVKKEFDTLTGESSIDEEANKMEIFYGKINNDEFHFYCEPGRRLHSPEIKGKLIKEKYNLTKIEIEIIASPFYIICDIIWIIIMSYITFFTEISPKWNEIPKILKYVFLFLGIFLIPIMNNIHYFYNLKNMLDDIVLYSEGYYNKYIK
jgi:hypothetical protein